MYVFFIFVLFCWSYFSWRKQERSTSTIWSWPTSCAHSTSIPRLWWLPPRWVRTPSSTFLPPNNIIFFRAVFSFRHFCVSLIYHDTYLPSHYMLPLLLYSAIPTASARSILEEELAVAPYLLNIFLTDRCPLILHPVNLILFLLFLLTLCCVSSFSFGADWPLAMPPDCWKWKTRRQ